MYHYVPIPARFHCWGLNYHRNRGESQPSGRPHCRTPFLFSVKQATPLKECFCMFERILFVPPKSKQTAPTPPGHLLGFLSARVFTLLWSAPNCLAGPGFPEELAPRPKWSSVEGPQSLQLVVWIGGLGIWGFGDLNLWFLGETAPDHQTTGLQTTNKREAEQSQDRSLSIYTPIWICTFANCQCLAKPEERFSLERFGRS